MARLLKIALTHLNSRRRQTLMSLLGVNANQFSGLIVMAAIFGFGGSLVSLLMSKWVAKRFTGAQVIAQPRNEGEQGYRGLYVIGPTREYVLVKVPYFSGDGPHEEKPTIVVVRPWKLLRQTTIWALPPPTRFRW